MKMRARGGSWRRRSLRRSKRVTRPQRIAPRRPAKRRTGTRTATPSSNRRAAQVGTAKRTADGFLETTATSLTEFLTKTQKFHDDWSNEDPLNPLWFRGQSDAVKPLQPGFYRDETGRLDENEARYEFQRRAIQFPMIRTPSSDWEWYFLMQHYGSPTRLLDWTEGALLGLHFALCHNDGKVDAAVWVLDPFWLNEHVLKRSGTLGRLRGAAREFVREFLPDPDDRRTSWIRRYLPRTYSQARLPRLPAALQPPHIDRRIAAQRSAFTIHGSSRLGLEEAARQADDPRLAKIRIPAARVEEIRRHLMLAGVTETTVFADLEGLGREVAYLFTERPTRDKEP
jgi:FRG domain-containing protein